MNIKLFHINKTYIAVLLTICCLLAGCNKENDIVCVPAGDATLSLNISVPGYKAQVKSVSGNPSDPQTWSVWERAVDGRYLYKVTAFLLDGNRLIAKEDLDLSGEPQEASLSFNGNFTHGTYKLMVVANYSSHTANDGNNGDITYYGIEEFSQTIKEILETQGPIDNFTTLYSSQFINYRIVSANGVCPRVPQPLTLVKDIELLPGVNRIEGELMRTYSRIRIMVDNHSDEQLSIKSLEFNNIFTQKESYLFENLGYISNRTTIDVAHEYAITPFTATAQNPVIIAPKQRSVIFDAYILESKRSTNGLQYSYKMNLGYEGMGSFILESTTPINKKDQLQTGHYIIHNTGSNSYLVAGNNSVETRTLSTLANGMDIPEEYVWTLEKNGSGDNYYIGTADEMTEGETSYFMSNPTTNSVVLGANKSVYFTFEDKESSRQSYLTIRSSGSGSRYLNVSNNKVTGATRANNTTAYFRLYPVSMPLSTTEVDIPLETIDNTTGQPQATEEIKRNDFINTVVTVSYNKNKGHFEFEVNNWKSGGGDVNFN